MHIFLSSAGLKHIICAHPSDQCQSGENGFPREQAGNPDTGEPHQCSRC